MIDLESEHWLGIAQLAATIGAAAIIIYQIHAETKRIRLRTSHETLTKLVSGDFVEILDYLLIEFGWDILLPGQLYEMVADSISGESKRQEKLQRLDTKTAHLLRTLEAASISCDRSIITEDVFREYMFSMMPTIFRNTEKFIAHERKRRNENKVFEHLQRYAERWSGKEGGGRDFLIEDLWRRVQPFRYSPVIEDIRKDRRSD